VGQGGGEWEVAGMRGGGEEMGGVQKGGAGMKRQEERGEGTEESGVVMMSGVKSTARRASLSRRLLREVWLVCCSGAAVCPPQVCVCVCMCGYVKCAACSGGVVTQLGTHVCVPVCVCMYVCERVCRLVWEWVWMCVLSFAS